MVAVYSGKDMRNLLSLEWNSEGVMKWRWRWTGSQLHQYTEQTESVKSFHWL